MNWGYVPWTALAATCMIAVTFLVLWSIAEVRGDRQADLIDDLADAVDECEDDLQVERMRLDEAREEIGVRDREIRRLNALITSITNHPSVRKNGDGFVMPVATRKGAK